MPAAQHSAAQHSQHTTPHHTTPHHTTHDQAHGQVSAARCSSNANQASIGSCAVFLWCRMVVVTTPACRCNICCSEAYVPQALSACFNATLALSCCSSCSCHCCSCCAVAMVCLSAISATFTPSQSRNSCFGAACFPSTSKLQRDHKHACQNIQNACTLSRPSDEKQRSQSYHIAIQLADCKSQESRCACIAPTIAGIPRSWHKISLLSSSFTRASNPRITATCAHYHHGRFQQ